ncbi:hypothetical protein [Salinimicrobium sp. WS361]|uniref:hypothetical protein n=1 Tax=Salinimicrobium sp. WS361 TaxID=3425123 RepID=UPI003D6F13A7
MVSCEEDLLVYDVDNGQTLAEFSTDGASLATAEEGASTTVEVAVSTRSSKDRSIEVVIDEEETTATPDQYEISDLYIPANSFVGTITITSNFEALPESGSTVLSLNLVGIEGSDASITHDTYEVELFRWCTTTLDEYVGTWTGPGAWNYPTQVETFLNEDGELMMTGLMFGWIEIPWGEPIVTSQPVKLDVNLETGEITIAEQPYATTTYEGEPQAAYYLRGTGTILNSCEKVLQIKPVLVQPDGAGVLTGPRYGGPVFTETIQLIASDAPDSGDGDGSSEE